jgi:hypothetical protein
VSLHKQIERANQGHDSAPLMHYHPKWLVLEAPLLRKLHNSIQLFTRTSERFARGSGDGFRRHGNPLFYDVTFKAASCAF